MKNYVKNRLVVIVGILVLAFLVGLLCGRFLLKGAGSSALEASSLLSNNVDELQAENAELKRKIAIFENASRVDRLAEQRTTADLLELQGRLAAAHKELEFYHRIISPENKNNELQIQSFRLIEGRTPKYIVNLSQGIGKNRLVKGSLHIQATGLMDGEHHVLSLMDFDVKRRTSIDFSFRYFQSIEGELDWPDGFVLESIQVWIKPETQGLTEITKSWELDELRKMSILSKDD